MNIVELIKTGANIKVEVSSNDLILFAEYILEKAKEVNALNAIKNTPQEEKWLTNEEAAELCKVSKTTLWAWDKAGYLCASKLGRRKVYALSDINNLLNSKNLKTAK